MRDDVTTDAMLTQLGRLTAAIGRPFGLDTDSARLMGEEYAGAFRRRGVPYHALERAVDVAIEEGKTGKFPSAGALIELAAHFIARPDGGFTYDAATCPHCRCRYFYAGYEFAPVAERGHARYSRGGCVLPKLRCACQQTDPAWYTDAASAWREDDPSKHGGRLMPRDYPEHPRYRDRKDHATISAPRTFTKAVA